MSVWVNRLRTHPSGMLLVVQFLGVLAYPYMEAGIGRAVFSVFGLAVLLLAVWAVRSTPALTWVAVLLGLPVFVLTVLEGLEPEHSSVVMWSALLHGAFYLYTAYGLIRYLFDDTWVTRDEIFAVGAAFTVVAWAFAYLYTAVQVIWPGSFIAYADPEAPRTWMELLFLSFTTLTSTGLSDVVPVLPHARSVVMIEQVCGLMYVALVVARLVGLTIYRFRG